MKQVPHPNPMCGMHVNNARVAGFHPFHCTCDARAGVFATVPRDGRAPAQWRAEVEGNALLSNRGLPRTFKTSDRAYLAAAKFIAAAKAKEDALADFHQPKE